MMGQLIMSDITESRRREEKGASTLADSWWRHWSREQCQHWAAHVQVRGSSGRCSWQVRSAAGGGIQLRSRDFVAAAACHTHTHTHTHIPVVTCARVVDSPGCQKPPRALR